MNVTDYQVIIPAAGEGKRMGAGKNKLFLELQERPIILHTLEVFAADQYCKSIILVIQPNDEAYFKEILARDLCEGKLQIVYGGDERQYSVYNGLQAVVGADVVLVHDGARPFVRKETVHSLVRKAVESGAAIAAVRVKDTIKKVVHSAVVKTIDRSSLWQVQTPQAFRLSLLLQAHEKAKVDRFLGTDEASLIERMGQQVKIVESDYDNIKLTTPEDLYFAEAIIQKRLATK